MRLVVVEHIGPVPAPRIGLAGAEAFNPPAAIYLKGAQEDGVGPEVFVPLPNNNQENPFNPALIPVDPKQRHGCGKKKNVVMAKMDDVSRFFKELFGFAPIEEFNPPLPVPDHTAERHRVHPGHRMMAAHTGSDEDDNTFHILPFMPGPVQGEDFPPPVPGSGPGSGDVSGSLFSPGRLRTPPQKRRRHRDGHLALFLFYKPEFTDPGFFFFLPN